mmetsp:Transcript_143808/g.253721  ORF Transcript_143808/g.253721 Transcript_143808/m.253721 type:complete len:228 (-) Transcript_143808:2438-3121(-)
MQPGKIGLQFLRHRRAAKSGHTVRGTEGQNLDTLEIEAAQEEVAQFLQSPLVVLTRPRQLILHLFNVVLHFFVQMGNVLGVDGQLVCRELPVRNVLILCLDFFQLPSNLGYAIPHTSLLALRSSLGIFFLGLHLRVLDGISFWVSDVFGYTHQAWTLNVWQVPILRIRHSDWLGRCFHGLLNFWGRVLDLFAVRFHLCHLQQGLCVQVQAIQATVGATNTEHLFIAI